MTIPRMIDDDIEQAQAPYGSMTMPPPVQGDASMEARPEGQEPLPQEAGVAPTGAPAQEPALPAEPQPQQRSILGTDVAPGQQIPPDRMKQAEHLYHDPQAEEQFLGKQDFHNTMRDYGQRSHGISSAIIGLDWQDPNYAQKLAALHGQQGALLEEKAHYQQSHPWGSMESAHPGLLGKIGHAFGVAGNIAGEALIPGVMSSIPGSQANLNAKAGMGAAETAEAGKEGLQAQQANANEANAKHTEQETEDLQNPSQAPETAQQEATDITVGQNNANPNLTPEQKIEKLQETAQGFQKPSNAKPVLPHVTYDAGIPVSVTDGQQVYDVNDPKLPPGLKPLVDAATRAHGQKVTEESNKQAAAFGHQDATRSKAEDIAARKEVAKIYADPMQSAERTNVMMQNLNDALKNNDQQAMLSLLANHIGMTMGLQKGARITQAILEEAQKSQPWLANVKAKFDKDGYLSGVVLGPEQMKSMVNLARGRYREDVVKARNLAKYAGAEDDGPDRTPGNATMHYYLDQSKGNVNKAKQLASDDGWTVSSGGK